MWKLITIIILIIIIIMFIPIKYSITEDEMLDGYVLGITQTTGPYWKIISITGDDSYNLSLNELVSIKGFDPYRKLSKTVIANFQNTFYVQISEARLIKDEYLDEEFHELTIESWDIVYPIKREFSLFSRNKNYLNLFDFIRIKK